MASPPALHAAAARLDTQAGRLAATLFRVAAASGPKVWRGPVALHFGDALLLHDRRLERVIAELRGTAARLRRQADLAAAASAASPASPGPERGGGARRASGWGRGAPWSAP
ncbi:MAG: hypothetical protein M3P85_01695 [Actinomycetota bacterium]|nr:hypothetical protein [Actinomycetota bacterium]